MKKRNDEQILEIWEKSGLMDGVKKSQRSYLSKCLEDCANYMVERTGVAYAQDGRVETLMLPFVRRWFCRLVEEGEEPESVFEQMNYEDIFLTLREAIANYKSPKDRLVDDEAELLCLVVNTYVNKKERESVVLNWSASGLIEDLNEEEKVYCAKLLEEGAQKLLKNKSKSNYDTVFFPVIRRVYGELCKQNSPMESYVLIDLEDLRKKTKKFYKTYTKLSEFVDFDSWKVFYSIDNEAEYTILFCKQYIKKKYPNN